MDRYSFYLSFAAGEDEPWIARFHSDLERQLSVELGHSVRGMSDSRRHGAAAEHGLTAAACMVATLTDRYFRDPTCGLEWSTFTARIRLDEARRPGPATGCLIPVLWRPLAAGPPADVEAFDRLSLVASPGPGLFEHMRRRRNTVDDNYRVVVVETVHRIRAALERNLARWPETDTSLLDPAFGARVAALRSR